MKFYAVDAKDGNAPIYYTTKRAALTAARQAARDADVLLGETVDVEEVTLVPITKAVVLRLINIEGGYVDSSRVVATFKPKHKE